MLNIKIGDKIIFYDEIQDYEIKSVIKYIDFEEQYCKVSGQHKDFKLHFDDICVNLTTFKVYKEHHVISKYQGEIYYVLYEGKPYNITWLTIKDNKAFWLLLTPGIEDKYELWVEEWQVIPIKKYKPFLKELDKYVFDSFNINEEDVKKYDLFEYRKMINQLIYDNPDFELPQHLRKYI